MKYKVGDKVRIISKWPEDGSAHQNPFGKMDSWLGKVMTIDEVSGGYYLMREDKGERPRGGWAWRESCIAGPAFPKVVITTDGTITTAKMYNGKAVVKSAEAKCSKSDTFDFETGVALAFDRLLSQEEKKPDPGFQLSDMVPGRFGRTSRGKWFVVLKDTVVYEEGGYDFYPDFVGSWCGSLGGFDVVDCLVDARSFNHARTVVANPEQHRSGPHKIIWKRPGAKFE